MNTITTQTKTGTTVELTPEISQAGHPQVSFTLPMTSGHFTDPAWTTHKTGAVGVLAYCIPFQSGGKTIKEVFLTIPRADYDGAIAAAREMIESEKSRERESILSGETLIALHYHDGEYLSGYMVHGLAADLLIELGLAKEVSGWGTLVDAEAVKALGESFTYVAAAEYARPALEEKADLKKEAAEKRAAIFAEAKSTGEPVLLRHWIEDCDGSETDCSMDQVTVYAMPDGTTKTVHNHTF